MENQVIVGQVEAGRVAEVKTLISNLIEGVNTSTFDLAELLHEAKSNTYYEKWGYQTFKDYAQSLDLKITKAYYLVRIVEVMKACGIPREEYEKAGVAKLRTISKLDPLGIFEGKAMSTAIEALVKNADTLSNDDVHKAVNVLAGHVGDQAPVYEHFRFTQGDYDTYVRPALEMTKKKIGSVGKDEDGNFKDASDSAAFVAICQDALADPNNFYDTDALNKQ